MWNPLANLPPSNALAPYATTMAPPTQIAPVPPGRGGGVPLNPIYGGAGRGNPIPAGWTPPSSWAPYFQQYGYVPGGQGPVQGLPGNEMQTQMVGAPPAPDGGVSATGVMADPNSFRAAIQAWRAGRPAMPDWQALIADARANGGFDSAGFRSAIDDWRGQLMDWRGQRPQRSGF